MKKSYDFSRAKRGAVLTAPPGKSRITIRIDDDVLEWFRKQAHRAGGASYQTMMNEALREWVETQREPLEDTLRRVLTEVLEEGPTRRRRPAKKKVRSKKAAKKKAQ